MTRSGSASSFSRVHTAHDDVAITAHIVESKHCAWDNRLTPYLFSLEGSNLRYRKCAFCLTPKEKYAIEILLDVLGRSR